MYPCGYSIRPVKTTLVAAADSFGISRNQKAVKIVLPEGTSRAPRTILAVDGDIDISDATFSVYIGDTKQPLRVMKTADGLKVAAEGTIIRLR